MKKPKSRSKQGQCECVARTSRRSVSALCRRQSLGSCEVSGKRNPKERAQTRYCHRNKILAEMSRGADTYSECHPEEAGGVVSGYGACCGIRYFCKFLLLTTKTSRRYGKIKYSTWRSCYSLPSSRSPLSLMSALSGNMLWGWICNFEVLGFPASSPMRATSSF